MTAVKIGVDGAKAAKVMSAAPKVANGLQIGQKVSGLGRVVENAPGKITGFNHDGSFHGIDRVIGRNVSPQRLLDVVTTPLVTFDSRYGRQSYLTRDAFVTLDQSGNVVTAWTQKEFKATIKNLLNSIK